MRTSRHLTNAAVLLLIATGLAPRPASAEDDPLERALELRNASSADFEAKNYTAAAEKLRQAAAIYAGLKKPPVGDFAITLRALVWNEHHAGQHDELVEDILRLQRLVAEYPRVESELHNAMNAQWQAAKAQPSLEKGEAILKPMLEAAYRYEQHGIAGQTLHNLGSLARDKGNVQLAVDYYERAIGKREETADWVGLCWSSNNLANLHLVNRNDVLAALDPLDRAHRLVHEQGTLGVQAAVAWNLRDAIARVTRLVEEAKQPLPPAAEAWVRALMDRAALTTTGVHVSHAYLARQWLAWIAPGGDADRVEAAAKAIVGLRDRSAPEEVQADLVLRACEAVIEVGRPKTAATWLKRFEAGQGLCASHLEARKAVLEARILAAAKPTYDEVPEAALRAFALWKAESDRRGQKDAYRALLHAGTEAGVVEALADIQKALNELLSEGVPGGPGGFATASGNVRRMNQLEWDDALFMIRRVKGGIEVADLATGAEHVLPVEWSPKNIGFNGLALQLFGGYVVVKRLDYGGAASADGGSGEATLDSLGDYWPVPAVGALVVQKNGAVRHRRK